MKTTCDVMMLQRLAKQLRKDAETFHALHPAAMNSCAEIIEQCIGAPILMPTFDAGVMHADEFFKGDPYKRAAFNYGVRWAVEQAEKGLSLEDIQSVEVGK